MEFSSYMTNGVNIFYAIAKPDACDDGIEPAELDTVLILHGWGVKKEDYASVIDILSPHMRVVIPDLPGFGESDEPRSAWCVDDYANAILDLIQHLGINKLSIIGHSFGGRIIIKMVSRGNLPFEVTSLVLIDSAGIKSQATKTSAMKKLIYSVGKWALSLDVVKRFFPDALYNLQGRLGSADYRNASPIMREVLISAINEDLTPYLSEITCPTLLFWGDLDTATPLSHAKIMEKLIPDCGLVVAHGAGHYSFIEQPFLFTKVMYSFFNIDERG